MTSDPGGSRYAKGERVHLRAPDVSGTFSVRVLNLPWDAMKEEVRSENSSKSLLRIGPTFLYHVLDQTD